MLALILILVLGCSSQQDSAEPEAPVDDDGDGYRSDVDCDETNANVHPDAPDATCDGVDDDCDGHIDEDAGEARLWYADTDGDGYGNFESYQAGCSQPAGFVEDFRDCDDQQTQVHPDQTDDQCDGVDGDCDGQFDEDSADALLFYVDDDDDGYGNSDQAIYGCSAPAGTVASADDCDDGDPGSHPGGAETCDDHADQDCDGVTDDGCGGPVRVDLAGFPLVTGTLTDKALLSFNPVIGLALAGGGDSDGDGLDDVAVGLPHAYQGEDYYLGKIYFVSEVPSADRQFSDHVGSISGEIEWANFGGSLAFVGDVDGDTDDELVVGAENQVDDLGAAYVFQGGPATDRTLSDASAVVTGTEDDADFGLGVTNGGNALGVGHSFLVASLSEGGTGAVYAFDAAIAGAHSAADAAAVLVGEAGSQCSGEGLSSGDDLNGDGVDDVVIGAGGACEYAEISGTAWVVFGPLAGTISLAQADARLSGTVADGQAGASVLQPGDFDGDGRGDIVISAPAIETAPGRNGVVYVWTDSLEGEIVLDESPVQFTTGAEDWSLEPPLSAAGDVDRDGRADFLASTPYGGTKGQGGAYLLTHIAVGTWDASEVGSWLSGATEYSYYGAATAGTSDLDGDGFTEIAVGGQAYFVDETEGEDVGAVSIVSTAGWF